MLASLADAPLDDPALVYEPKYDGIRAIAEVDPKGRVHLWSRLGNEKTNQFPESANALATWAKRLKAPVILDGEIVALDDKGEPTGFQQLQGRIHLSEGPVPSRPSRPSRPPPPTVAFIAFDILPDGRTDLRDRPLTQRRKVLKRVPGKTGSPLQRISTAARGDGTALSAEARVMTLLKPLEINESPFCERIKTNERAHWVRPELVAQIKFTEWTADGKLRHPVYLGLRDDKKPEEIRREEKARVRGTKSEVRSLKSEPPSTKSEVRSIETLIAQLRAIEDSRRDGVVTLPDGDTLKVTNLHKVFWPKQKLTKGDLFRYYARVAPFVLPAVEDRPLVMKRYPNGIAGQWFYQHRIENVPPGVRVEMVREAGPGGRGPRSKDAKRPQIVGGNLKTLLYTTQLAAISQDPWFSRVQHPEFADYAALDLDPSESVPFARVLDVARWIRDELDTLRAIGVPKTSGASGMHVYIPLPPETPYDAGLLFCQIIATVVAQKHPKVATIERSVKARGPRVYVDFLQNILGKTLATAYSARASDYAGVSTPLAWKEVDAGIDPHDFTIETVPARAEQVGDLWAALRKSKGVDLSKVARYAERSGKRRLKGDKS